MSFYGNDLFYALLFASLFVLQIVWRFASAPIRDAAGATRRHSVADLLFCMCMALAVGTLFRLFPGNGRAPETDSSVFLYIGQRMLDGKAPYRDLFDHKGPLLYLIQLAGLTLTPHSFAGVWVMEVVNMFFTAMLLLRLADLFSDQKAPAYLAVMAAIGVCGWKIWQGGNFTEEYALPWITWSAVIFFRYFRAGSYRAKDIFFLGFCFAVVLMLRANMVAVWVALTPAVLVSFVRKKQFACIGQCILTFLGGAALVLLPVVVWAAYAGFLKELWSCYILFNFQYSDNAFSAAALLQVMLRFARVIWPGTVALILSLLLDRRNVTLWLNLLFYAVSLYTTAMSGRAYHHYAIVLLPAIVLPMCAVFQHTGMLLGKRKNADLRPSVAVLTSVVVLLGAFAYRKISPAEPEIDPVTDYLLENTKQEDDVLVLGKNYGYYLQAGRQTENRFFYQLPPLEISQELRDAFKQELLTHPSDYIVFPGDAEYRDEIRAKFRDVWPALEQDILKDFDTESYDTFEIYIRRRENGNG